MKFLRRRKFTSRHKINIFLCSLLLPIHVATGHNKVVVIPLAGDDATIEPFAPVAPNSPANSNYSITVARPTVAVDLSTGLMWQRSDDDTFRTWDDAFDYCSDLVLGVSAFGGAGFKDWRLPSRTELQSLVDYDQLNPPRINTVVFLNTNPSVFWSSSVANESGKAWLVSFSNGVVLTNFQSVNYLVRCVR